MTPRDCKISNVRMGVLADDGIVRRGQCRKLGIRRGGAIMKISR